MVLVLRLCLGQHPSPHDKLSREILGELDGVLGKLATLAGSAPPEAWAEGSMPAAPLPARSAGLPSCDLAEVVHRAHGRHLRLFEPEVRFEEAIEPGRALVAMSSQRVERIVHDLLVRARDVTPDGGVVKLRVEPGDTFVRVTIEDGGRCGHETEAVDSGLELLAFWWRLIGQGNLTLQSRAGRGSTFVLTLPTVLGEPSRSPDLPES